MSRSRWAVAIGAGREQMPSIARCQERGIRVLALDGDPRAPGLRRADDVVVVDLLDVEAVLGAIDRHPIEWCVPAPIGRVLRTVGAVNDRLGLPGISGAGAAASTDKDLFDRLVRTAGARRPRRLLVEDAAHLGQAAVGVGPPCVIKPTEGSGSRGVTVCQDRDDVERAVAAATGGPEGPWLVEELVVGPEVGVDGVVVDGRFHLVLVRDKELTELPDRQELAYAVPTRHDAGPIVAEVQRCVDAMGLDRCALNADVIVAEAGPTVLELAGRPAGLLVGERLVAEATGVDLLDLAIDVLDGAPAPIGPPPVRPLALRFVDSAPGIVRSRIDPVALRREVVVEHAEIWMRVGDELGPIRTAADVFARGVVITGGSDREAAVADAERIVGQIRDGRWSVEPVGSR